MMWRHGDVMIASVPEVPAEARRLPAPVLAYGEVTGHTHRVEDPASAQTFSLDGLLYLKVTADWASIVHEEHKRITLPRGFYRVWQQREYTPQAVVRVSD